jgi:hypothetical protein
VRITTVGDLAIYNGGKFGWSGTSSSSGALDVSLTRNAAAVLQIGDGGANANGTLLAAKVYPNPTFTASGTTGAQTINKQVFSVNFAASAASLVVTNSFVTATSGLVCTVNANDTTMKSAAAVPASGSVTLYPNTAPTAETKVTCQVFN